MRIDNTYSIYISAATQSVQHVIAVLLYKRPRREEETQFHSQTNMMQCKAFVETQDALLAEDESHRVRNRPVSNRYHAWDFGVLRRSERTWQTNLLKAVLKGYMKSSLR